MVDEGVLLYFLCCGLLCSQYNLMFKVHTTQLQCCWFDYSRGPFYCISYPTLSPLMFPVSVHCPNKKEAEDPDTRGCFFGKCL